MLNQLSAEINQFLARFPQQDQLIFNNKSIGIDPKNFTEIKPAADFLSIAFIDGGQAEIVSTGNLSLSFIRIFAQIFEGEKKVSSHKKEFYLFTRAKWDNNDLLYESRIFGDRLFDERDLVISSNDTTIRKGIERASISQVAGMARRFAELSLAKQVHADFILLDGTLTPTFKGEEKIISFLPENICALAKSSSLFTISGNSPAVLLNRLGPEGCWKYAVERKTSFVKLHPHSRHVFRFEGNPEILPHLSENSRDPLFLGYPYGLVFADKFARISNQEKNSLRSVFLLKPENRRLAEYLSTSDAHHILDTLS